ncbi:MAG: hypothetical protein ACLFRT_14245 [Actinomycetota bacterium]
MRINYFAIDDVVAKCEHLAACEVNYAAPDDTAASTVSDNLPRRPVGRRRAPFPAAAVVLTDQSEVWI